MAQMPCPSCGAVNRLAEGKDPVQGKCGRCHAALFSGHPVEVTGEQLDRYRRSAKGVAVLLDVWAPWCGPCRSMAPHFEAAAAKLEPEAVLLKLNSEDHPAAAQRLGVQGIPALYLFRDGEIVARTAGARTSAELVSWVKQSMG